MKLALARGWLPALITYSDGLPEDMGAMTLAFFVVIRPKYRDDRGLHEHQLEHVAQWYAILGTMLLLALFANFQNQGGVAAGLGLAAVGMQGLLYRRSRKFRLLSEAQAFLRQMRFPDRHGKHLSVAEAANRLCSSRYDLDLSLSQAVAKMEENGKPPGSSF